MDDGRRARPADVTGVGRSRVAPSSFSNIARIPVAGVAGLASAALAIGYFRIRSGRPGSASPVGFVVGTIVRNSIKARRSAAATR